MPRPPRFAWRRCIGGLLCTCAFLLAGGQSSRCEEATPFRIATLDLERLFEEHPLHQALVELVEEQEEFAKQQAKRHQRRLAEARQRLQKAEKGSRQYKRSESEISRLELNEELGGGQTAMPLDGDALFGRILVEIHQATERYRREHDISLVLRRSNDQVNEADAPVVFGILQRFVLYDPGLDITDEVLGELQKSADLP
ncbi:MAG: OmpH family outer membrane protein [Pirellulales bacterium]